MASFDLRWRSSTKKDLRKLPVQEVSRIVAVVAKLAEEPFPPGTQKLAGSEHVYRVRVGDCRVVYEVRLEAKLLEVQRVRHRKDVYR